MNWKGVGEWIAGNAGTGAALVGSLVTGNVPEAIAAGVSMISSATGTTDPQKALEALQTDPATIVKLRELANANEADIRKHLETIHLAELSTGAQQVDAVNKTLQTEAMGGSWLQRNHHAVESMATVALVWAIYFILPMISVPVPSVPESAWLTLGAILGVTAWQRGQANVKAASQ